MPHPNLAVVNTLMQRIPLTEKQIDTSLELMAQALIDATVQSAFVTEDLIRAYAQMLKHSIQLLEYALAIGTKMNTGSDERIKKILEYHVSKAHGDILYIVAKKAGDSNFTDLVAKATQPADLRDA